MAIKLPVPSLRDRIPSAQHPLVPTQWVPHPLLHPGPGSLGPVSLRAGREQPEAGVIRGQRISGGGVRERGPSRSAGPGRDAGSA